MGKKRKCRKKWRAIFAGSPDLVAGAEDTCSSRSAAKRILAMPYPEARRWYLEDVLGDLASIGMHGRDEDTENGTGSELIKGQQDFTADLIKIQEDLLNQKTLNDRISLALANSQIQNQEQAKKQQQNILYIALAALVILIIVTQIKK